MTPGETQELSELRLQSEQRLQAEIATLRADFNDCNFNRAHWRKEAERLRIWLGDAEMTIAKLRAAGRIMWGPGTHQEAVDEIDRLTVENATLRAALELIAGLREPTNSERISHVLIARAVLEETK